jgi:hypothetical protein
MLNEGDYIRGLFTYLNLDAKFLAKPVSDIRGVLRAPNHGISGQENELEALRKPVDDCDLCAGLSTSTAVRVSDSAVTPRNDDGPVCRQRLDEPKK